MPVRGDAEEEAHLRNALLESVGVTVRVTHGDAEYADLECFLFLVQGISAKPRRAVTFCSSVTLGCRRLQGPGKGSPRRRCKPCFLCSSARNLKNNLKDRIVQRTIWQEYERTHKPYL